LWLDLLRRSAERERLTLTLFLNLPLGRRRTYCLDLPVVMSWRRDVFPLRRLVFPEELRVFIGQKKHKNLPGRIVGETLLEGGGLIGERSESPETFNNQLSTV